MLYTDKPCPGIHANMIMDYGNKLDFESLSLYDVPDMNGRDKMLLEETVWKLFRISDYYSLSMLVNLRSQI